MFSLPNLLNNPRANEAVKDLFASAIGFGVLRLVGIKYEVGQLSIKTFVFGAGTAAVGSFLGREAYIRYQGADLDFDDRKTRNAMNKNLSLASLAAFTAGAFALTQYSRVGAYLPTFTQLSKNQAYALGGSAILAMVGLRFFGFADQAKAVKGRDPLPQQPTVYDEKRHGALESKEMVDMQALSRALQAKQVRFATKEQAQAYNDRIDALHGQEGHDQLVKVEIPA